MSLLNKLSALFAPEQKASETHRLIALQHPVGPVWTPRDYTSMARNGVVRNVVAHRCVRLIAETASAVPLNICEQGEKQAVHPLLELLSRPNPEQTGAAFLEEIYGYLQTMGNAYIEAVRIDGQIRELYALRPDRVKIRPDNKGWPGAYEYRAGPRKILFTRAEDGFLPILHIKLFHPINDHYGLAPLEAAGEAVDIHNAASAWNKALLDNAARPSGALIYNGPEGTPNLTAEQFERLKTDLQENWQGRANAGRPLVLDGGLDWKQMSMSPSDMDFIEAKHSAARDIALAFGVPPQLLGIPGDNTYSNYKEANLAFWRQTILPLTGKTAGALSGWLCPVSDGVRITHDPSRIDAFSPDRDARLQQILQAEFLTEEEKRAAFGFPPVKRESL
ncbi:MAG: phage portal protein [bacterium]